MRYSVTCAALAMAVIFSSDTSAQLLEKRYPLPLATLGGKEICNARECVPASRDDGLAFHYVVRPYMINRKVAGSAQGAAAKIVGHVRRSDDLSGDTPLRCGKSNPFQLSDVQDRLGDGGIPTEYKVKDALKIDVTSKVDADIAAMKALGLPTAKMSIQDARAKLTAAYTTLRGSELIYKGTYLIFSLSDETYLDMKQLGLVHNDSSCFDYLRKPFKTPKGELAEKRLITDVGLVEYHAEFSNSNASDVVSDLQSTIQSSGIAFDLGASVERSMDTQMKQKLDGAVGIISVISVPASALGIDLSP